MSIAGQCSAAAHSYRYDPAGRPVTETDPAGAVTATSYTPGGRPDREGTLGP